MSSSEADSDIGAEYPSQVLKNQRDKPLGN